MRSIERNSQSRDTFSIFKGGGPNNKEYLRTTLATSLEMSKAKGMYLQYMYSYLHSHSIHIYYLLHFSVPNLLSIVYRVPNSCLRNIFCLLLFRTELLSLTFNRNEEEDKGVVWCDTK